MPPPPPSAPSPPPPVPTAFSYFGDAHAVFLSGTFNRWAERIPLDRGGHNRLSEWAVVLSLPPGEYAYKYIVEQPEGVLRWETAAHEPMMLASSAMPSCEGDAHATAAAITKAAAAAELACANAAAAGAAPVALNNWQPVLRQDEHDGPEESVTADVGPLAALAIVAKEEAEEGYSQNMPQKLIDLLFATAHPPLLPRHLYHYASELRDGGLAGRSTSPTLSLSPTKSAPNSPPQGEPPAAAVLAGGALAEPRVVPVPLVVPLPPALAFLRRARAETPPPPEAPPPMLPDSAAYGGEHSHATLGHLGWTYTAGGSDPAGGVARLCAKRRVRHKFVTLELVKPVA